MSLFPQPNIPGSNPILDYTPTRGAVDHLTSESISRLNTLQFESHAMFPLPDNIKVERISKPTYYYKVPHPVHEIPTAKQEVMQHVRDKIMREKMDLIRTAPNDRFYGEDELLYEELMLQSIRYLRELQQKRIHSLEKALQLRREEQWASEAAKLRELGKRERVDPNSLEALLSGYGLKSRLQHEAKNRKEQMQPSEVKQVRFGAEPKVERQRSYTNQTSLKIVSYGEKKDDESPSR